MKYTTLDIAREVGTTYTNVGYRISKLEKELSNFEDYFYREGNNRKITERGRKLLLESFKAKPSRSEKAVKKKRKENLNLTKCLKCKSELNDVGLHQTYCRYCDTWYYKGFEVTYDRSGNIIDLDNHKMQMEDKGNL